MALKLKVQTNEVKLKISTPDEVKLKGSIGIPIYPDPYTGETEVTPTEEEQTLSTNGLMVNDDITVHAVPSDYVGSAIDRRDEDDLTASADVVSVPAGFYESSAAKSVGVGSATTPALGIEVTPSISVNSSGLITATATKSESITPVVVSGYVGEGTPGTVTFSGTNTSQLSTQGAKTVSPTESEQTAVASGKYTTGTVKVGAIPSDYVGTGIARKDSDDLTASGATITAPAGYYAESASKSVASGSASTPATSITANPSISVNSSGLITSTASATKSVTPTVSEGYVSSGTAGTITVSGSNTSQLSTQAGTTITPTESEQTAVASGKYTTGAVKVGAISSTYVGTGVTRRDSDDLSASGATVTAPSGYYAESATKTIASGSATPAASITATGAGKTVGNGTITLTKSAVSNTPQVTAGYISSGTAGNTSVSLTASVTTQAGQTIHPSTTDQSIAANTYVLGAQTIKGVLLTNLDASNIKDGVTVKVGDSTDDDCVASVTGTYSGGGGTPNLQTKTNIDPTTSSQTITADAGYDGLDSVQINAMPSGTAGTPTATKGTVSNHSVSVTPSVTNTTGYITGSTKTGTAVSVTASELVSGSVSITASGNTDVTNYATASVASGSATASAAKGTVSNHSITVTPSVTRTAGYITAGSANGTAVTVSASELVSGSETKTENGTYDVTNLASLVVNVSGGGASNIKQGTFTTGSTGGGTATFDTGYSGSGYPIALIIYVDGGAYNNGTGGNTTWYNSVTRYDCGWYAMVKSRTTTTPTYGTSGADNYGTVAIIYKNSTSTATTYTRTSSMTANSYSSSNAGASTACARFKGNGKTVSYYIGNAGSSTIGFAKSTKYAYIAIYSS